MASEGVVESLLLGLVIQYPTHQIVVPTHVCVERSSHINKEAQMLFTQLEGTYIDGISLTHGAPGSRSHIWTFAGAVNDFAGADVICACTNSIIHGLILFLLSSVTITSATLVIMMQDIFLGCIIQMTLCLTDRGVVLIASAASSTLLHGFARNYHNQPVTILRLGSVEVKLLTMKMWLFP